MSQTNQANPSEFPEGQRERQKVKPLPPSSDKEFWGEDADINLVNKKNLTPLNQGPHGNYIQRGQFVICQNCEAEHTIPGFTLNRKGELVKLDKPPRIVSK